MSSNHYSGPKFQLGRIYNKHLILDLFAYCDADIISMTKIFYINRQYRFLLINNYGLTKAILVQLEPVKVFIGSTFLRNELSFLNFKIAASRLDIELTRKDQIDLLRIFCSENRRVNLEKLTLNAYALEISSGYQYDLSLLGNIAPRKLWIKQIEYDLDVQMLPKSAKELSLDFANRIQS